MSKVLSYEAKQLMIEGIRKKIKQGCIKCGGTSFNGKENLVNIPYVTYIKNHCDPTGIVLVAWPLVCNNCGFIELYSLHELGLSDVFIRNGEQMILDL